MIKLRKRIWNLLSDIYPFFLRKFFGMKIGKNVRIARKAHLDKNINPQGIHIGDNTWILANVMILAHDYCRGENGIGKLFDTYIGKNCVIGINSVILPGVKLGDSVVVAAGSIVTKDIPSNSMVAGNPAKVISKGVVINDKGQIENKGQKVE